MSNRERPVSPHNALTCVASFPPAGLPTFIGTTKLSDSLRQPIPACHYLIDVSGADQVRVTPYATFGSNELARQTVAGLGKDNCILMANHGLLAAGEDIQTTYNTALYIASENSMRMGRAMTPPSSQ